MTGPRASQTDSQMEGIERVEEVRMLRRAPWSVKTRSHGLTSRAVPMPPQPEPQDPERALYLPAVEVTRGSLVESVHCASMAVCDARGSRVAAFGSTGHPVFLRS